MSTAGYSGTPLPRKLGIREGSRLLLVDPPEDFGATLGELPAGVESLGEGASAVDVAVLFAPDAAAVRTRFASLAALAAAGRRALDRVAEAQLRRGHRPRREPRARDRPGRGTRRQQGLRDRCHMVGPALRMASARPAGAYLRRCKSLQMGETTFCHAKGIATARPRCPRRDRLGTRAGGAGRHSECRRPGPGLDGASRRGRRRARERQRDRARCLRAPVRAARRGLGAAPAAGPLRAATDGHAGRRPRDR